ncbi:MAG: DHA2 family efflux MFS transporter permease subunit [Rhodospirillaceae bacterium]|nr:MAG: DHA2 family efflux MFS transporter permease subunit [Rhodospirillaceae bacterium]
MSQDLSPESTPAAPVKVTAKTLLLTVALMLAAIMQALDATIANVALPHMQGSMSAAQDQIMWVLTSYMVMAGICTPLTGYIVRRYGRKRLFLFSVVSFTITSMFCGAAQSLGQIVVFRILQGASGAFVVPLSQTIIMDIYPKEKHAPAIAAWSMGTLIAPIMGPTLGGYLTEILSWRWAFYINLPFGILSTIGVVMFLSESKRDPNAKFDLFGFALLGTAIGALQMMLDRGTTLDWFSSGEIIIEGLLAVLAFYIFVAHMFTATQPFLSRTAFKNVNYVIGLSTGFVVILVIFGTASMIPSMLQNLMGYPVLTTGMLLMPRGVGNFLSVALAGHLVRSVDARLLILFGLAMMATMLWQMSEFTLEVSDQEIMVNGLLQGLGMGFIFLPLTIVTFATLAPQFRTEGTSMYSLMRNLGVSIGVSVDSTFLARNTQVNHSELMAHITPFNRVLQALLPTVATKGAQSAVALEGEITRQAGMIAYNDLFRLATYLAIGAALIVPFMRVPKKGVPDEPVIVEA